MTTQRMLVLAVVLVAGITSRAAASSEELVLGLQDDPTAIYDATYDALGDAATDKRATTYGFGLGKRATTYGFGLGKRGSLYGFGLGKRATSYGFGLGKRASSYGFGLGKRSSYDHGHDKTTGHGFGQSKRQTYGFGLGKRTWSSWFDGPLRDVLKRPSYGFGLGKRSLPVGQYPRLMTSDGILRTTSQLTGEDKSVRGKLSDMITAAERPAQETEGMRRHLAGNSGLEDFGNLRRQL